MARRATARVAGAGAGPGATPGPRLPVLVVQAEGPGGTGTLARGAASAQAPRAAVGPLVATSGPLRVATPPRPLDGGAAQTDRVAVTMRLGAPALRPLEGTCDGGAVARQPPFVRAPQGADALGIEDAGPDARTGPLPLLLGGQVDSHPPGPREAAQAEDRPVIGAAHRYFW